MLLGVRPEDLRLAEHGIEVRVEIVEELGADAYVHGRTTVDATEHDVVARVDGRRPPARGATVPMAPEPGRTHLFELEDEHLRRLQVVTARPSGGCSPADPYRATDPAPADPRRHS